MKNIYIVDTESFSIGKFREILKTKELLPGRMVLKENIDERFDLLETNGITTLSDLLEKLKAKSKIEKFSQQSGLSSDYLVILRREANSFVSIPVKLVDLPFDEPQIVDKLSMAGIKDSKELIDAAANQSARKGLSSQLQVSFEKLNELTQLSDLVRIPGVGPVFARIIWDSEIRSVKEFLSLQSSELLDRLNKTNQEKSLTKVKFSVKDIEYCINLGKELPIIFEK